MANPKGWFLQLGESIKKTYSCLSSIFYVLEDSKALFHKQLPMKLLEVTLYAGKTQD